MNASFCFAICSMFYILLIVIMYFSKERLKNNENKIYSLLLITTLIGVFAEILTTILELTSNTGNFLHEFLLKFIMVYYLTWIYLFFIYTYYVSKNSNKTNKKIIAIIYIILAIITFILPLYKQVEGNIVAYTYGPSIDFVYIFSGILIFGCIYLMIKNINYISKQKYLPLFAFIAIGIIVTLVEIAIPSLLLMSSMETFITVLMYFTIENPDLQMLRELYKNKKIIEKSNEDTSRFLFRVTQDIKKPVKEITDISNNITKENTKEQMIESLKAINNYSNQIDYLINKALNISDMDTKKIKVFENRYNVHNLFKEISYKALEEIKSPVKFNYNIGGSIPDYLYGDAIKLKHAINSLLKISKDYTTQGFISLDVSSIIKYNICRLIITVEDSGKGISIDRINEILSMTTDNIKEENVNEERNLNIFEIKKLINLIGGSLMIKSEELVGTTVTITLDQKIVETKETKLSQKLESYEQTLYSKKKILLIDDDEKELDKITKILGKKDIDVTSSMYGREAIEKINSKSKFDLIILDDELIDINALNILEELQKNKSFKIPVIVMINDNKEGIKLEYLKDGFADTISKSKLEIEINRIIKRF